MKKRTLSYCAAMLLSALGMFGGCNDTVNGSDCGVMCQDVDNTCVKKCEDDQCKTACKTDLDNCTASCRNITVSPPDGGSGGG